MITEILNLRREYRMSKKMMEVIDKVIHVAMKEIDGQEVGLRLAAAFDLLASMEYYDSVTNSGWTYCPDDDPKLFYAYTNICPRCIGAKRFQYTSANKPKSAQIGMVTTELVCVMLNSIFKKNNRNVDVYKASEPIDAILYDKDSGKVIVAEVKSAPLMTIPLAAKCDRMTANEDDDIIEVGHKLTDHASLRKDDVSVYMYFPKVGTLDEKYTKLQVKWKNNKERKEDDNPFYDALNVLLESSPSFFDEYYAYWKAAFNAYASKDHSSSIYWLTNGCGQPAPRPDGWPKRRGAGYESVSDGKTSVGMDRTDDIKKAIYQVLKLGSVYKPQDDKIKTAIISNIHAVRHYEEYLETVRDIMWLFDDTGHVKQVNQLNQETKIYNLFDGNLSFTYSDFRDDWIKEIFEFGGKNG